MRQKWLRIIAINDVYELTNLPKLKTLCNQLAAAGPHDGNTNTQPNHTIVTLAGDFLSPSLLSSMDRGRGMVDVLNHIPVDYVCFGNHEADLPLDAIKKRVAEYQGTWLNTNMPTFTDSTVPYAILDLGDNVTIGLVGNLTDQTGVFSTDTFRGHHIDNVAESTLNAVATMQQELQELQEVQKLQHGGNNTVLNAVIPVTHQSIDDDERLADTLGRRCPVPVPLILGGHEHDLILRKCGVENNTQVVKAGSDATHAVVVDVFVRVAQAHPQDDETSRVTTHTKVIDVTALTPDPALALLCDHHEESIALMKEEVIIDGAVGNALGLGPLSSVQARHRQTTLGCVFATACREELLTDCAMINGGPIKGERTYPTNTVSYAQLQNELPFPTKMVSVPVRGQVLQASVQASRTGKEERGYLQLCDHMAVDAHDPTALVAINGVDIDVNQVYNVALPRNLLSGFCHIQPLVDLGDELKRQSYDWNRFDKKNSFVPALNLVVAYYAKDVWKRLGDFDDLDLNRDGVIDEKEIATAFFKHHGTHPSAPLLNNLMSTFDMTEDGVVSRSEFEQTMNKKFGPKGGTGSTRST